MAEDSILDDIKKVLGVDPEFDGFDTDILMHINATMLSLQQLHVGPDEGFFVADRSATWQQLLGDDPLLNAAKTYIFLNVKNLFDPPSTSHLVTAMNEQIAALGYRLNLSVETRPVETA